MVTILLATYNGAKYITGQLNSLLSQTYAETKILIRDDRSTDSTRSIIESYVERYPDKIVLIESETPSGSAKNNFFLLLSAVREGNYFMFCDQDDCWLPEKVELTLSLMREREQKEPDIPVLIHTDLIVADDKLQEIAPSFIRYQDLHPSRSSLNYMLTQNNITGCTIMFNRKLLDLALLTVDTRSVIMHDWWLGLLASSLGEVAYLDTPTILYRQHDNNQVGAIDVFSGAYFLKLLRRAFRPGQRSLNPPLQAGAFERCYGQLLSDSHLETIRAYSRFPEMGRLSRLKTTIKYKLYMQSRLRTILSVAYNFIFGK